VGRTILVIDDEPELVKLLDYNLTKAGYLVLSAKDGENCPAWTDGRSASGSGRIRQPPRCRSSC